MKLIERVMSQPQGVDAEAGVIRGAKVLGLESRNRRRYSPAAVSRARSLYENAKVNIDHSKERRFSDGVGVLKNVREAENGLYGDVHVLTSHPLGPSILEAAQKFPHTFGLSHVAEGASSIVNGIQEVTEIRSVESVDIVGNPATTNGIYESASMSTMTLRELVEQLANDTPGRAALNECLEYNALANLQVTLAEEAADPQKMETTALVSALSECMKQAKKRPPVEEPAPKVTEGDDKLAEQVTKLSEQVAKFALREAAIDALATAGHPIDPKLVAELVALGDETKIAEKVKSWSPSYTRPGDRPYVESDTRGEPAKMGDAKTYKSLLAC